MPKETLLNQLRRIIETMRNSGRKPLRIYLTWGMFEALRTELATMHRHAIDPAKMELFDIPLQISEPGTGLYVSCLSHNEEVKK